MRRTIATCCAGVALLPLGACVSTSVKGMRERAPVLVADSARPVAKVSECVTAAWIDAGLNPKLLPRAGGASLVQEVTINYTMIFATLDLDERPGGSHVELRIQKTLWAKQNRKRVDEVRACL